MRMRYARASAHDAAGDFVLSASLGRPGVTFCKPPVMANATERDFPGSFDAASRSELVAAALFDLEHWRDVMPLVLSTQGLLPTIDRLTALRPDVGAFLRSLADPCVAFDSVVASGIPVLSDEKVLVALANNAKQPNPFYHLLDVFADFGVPHERAAWLLRAVFLRGSARKPANTTDEAELRTREIPGPWTKTLVDWVLARATLAHAAEQATERARAARRWRRGWGLCLWMREEGLLCTATLYAQAPRLLQASDPPSLLLLADVAALAGDAARAGSAERFHGALASALPKLGTTAQRDLAKAAMRVCGTARATAAVQLTRTELFWALDVLTARGEAALTPWESACAGFELGEAVVEWLCRADAALVDVAVAEEMLGRALARRRPRRVPEWPAREHVERAANVLWVACDEPASALCLAAAAVARASPAQARLLHAAPRLDLALRNALGAAEPLPWETWLERGFDGVDEVARVADALPLRARLRLARWLLERAPSVHVGCVAIPLLTQWARFASADEAALLREAARQRATKADDAARVLDEWLDAAAANANANSVAVERDATEAWSALGGEGVDAEACRFAFGAREGAGAALLRAAAADAPLRHLRDAARALPRAAFRRLATALARSGRGDLGEALRLGLVDVDDVVQAGKAAVVLGEGCAAPLLAARHAAAVVTHEPRLDSGPAVRALACAAPSRVPEALRRRLARAAKSLWSPLPPPLAAWDDWTASQRWLAAADKRGEALVRWAREAGGGGAGVGSVVAALGGSDDVVLAAVAAATMDDEALLEVCARRASTPVRTVLARALLLRDDVDAAAAPSLALIAACLEDEAVDVAELGPAAWALLPRARGSRAAAPLLRVAAASGFHVECAKLVSAWAREGDDVAALSRVLVRTPSLRGGARQQLDCMLLVGAPVECVDAWTMLRGAIETVGMAAVHAKNVAAAPSSSSTS